MNEHIKVTSVTPKLCECGRLYEDRISHLGKRMCSACYLGCDIETLKKLWSIPAPNEIKGLFK